jgi:nucleoside-diphosphate-sugar epimerase
VRALVTGGAGFIGSHLVDRLVADHHEVVTVDCFTPYYDVAQKRENWRTLDHLENCTLVEADLRSCDLPPLLNEIDVVFHQAGQPGVRSSWRDGFSDYLEHNVHVTQRLLEATLRSGVGRVVYASSSSVYGDAPLFPTSEDDLPRPQSPYGVTKLAGEHLCGVYARNWDVQVVSLRYFTAYGPRQRPDMAMHRLIEAAMCGETFPLYGDGQQIRDFTFVDDIVEANIRAATNDVPAGTVMNVSGGTSTELSVVVSTIEEITGRTIRRELRPRAPGDVLRTGGAADRAAKLLDWSPRVGLLEGLTRQVAWHQQRAESDRSNPTEVVRSESI